MGPFVRDQGREVPSHLRRRPPRLSRRPAGGQDGLRPGAEVSPIRSGMPSSSQITVIGSERRTPQQVGMTAGWYRPAARW